MPLFIPYIKNNAGTRIEVDTQTLEINISHNVPPKMSDHIFESTAEGMAQMYSFIRQYAETTNIQSLIDEINALIFLRLLRLAQEHFTGYNPEPIPGHK